MRYWADRQIFLKDAKLSPGRRCTQRARQTAFLVPGLTIVVRDERGLDGAGHDRGDVPLRRRHQRVLRVPGPGQGRSATCCGCTGAGHLQGDRPGPRRPRPHDPDRGRRASSTSTSRCAGAPATTPTVKSFVNIIATPKGGTHVTGFERALTKTVNEVLRAAKLLRVAEDDIVKDDVLEGLTAVVTVRLAEPQFEGQTKEVLGTSAATRIVAHVVAKELKAFLTSTKRDAKAQARRRAGEGRRRGAHPHRRPAAQGGAAPQDAPWSPPRCRPSSPTAAATTSSAASCSSSRATRALGTAKLARNSEFQALLPIRGKILNVQKASVADMLKNAECAAIIQVIGAGLGPHLRHRRRPATARSS